MEIEAAVIGAVVGGVVGFLVASLRTRIERGRRKRALASVLLLELRSIEYLLRRLFQEPDNLTGDFQSAHFDRLDATVYELSGDATRLALSFKYRLDEIRQLRKRQIEKLSSNRRNRLKVKLYVAAQEVHKLKAALRASRGFEPPREEYKELRAGELKLPPRAFDYGPQEETEEEL
jgi:hypothetical protein